MDEKKNKKINVAIKKIMQNDLTNLDDNDADLYKFAFHQVMQSNVSSATAMMTQDVAKKHHQKNF